MKSFKPISVVFSVLICWQINFAQQVNESSPPPRPTPPPPITNSTPKVSESVSKNLEQTPDRTQIPRERREQAYIKLLEAQKHIWKGNPNRRQANSVNELRLARQALLKAIEFDPTLAEAYTSLAELASIMPPHDIEEAIRLANTAVKIDSGNFGGHRILARLYTIKSQLNKGILNEIWAQKAVEEWKEVGRLDPRSAEAFAFLSELYARMKMPNERIDALRKWLSAAAPLDSGFYRVVFNGQELSSENATVKYGTALLEIGETGEAIEILSRAVADNPDNEDAVELLSRAAEMADESSATRAVQFLQQAVFADPENTRLVEILAKLQMRTGKKNEALQTIRTIRARRKDNYSLLRLEATMLAENGKVDEAVTLVKSLIGKKAPAGNILPNIDSDGNEMLMNSLMYDDFSNYLFIANLYSQAKRGKEAVEAVNQAMTATQDAERRAIARLTLATVQHTTGDFRGAEETLRGILSNTPRNPIALNNLGYFLAERGEKLDEAVKLIEQALDIDPNNPSYLDSLGWAYFKLGKLGEAEKYLKEALLFNAYSSTVQEHLGDVYQKQGKLDLAKEAWRKALRLASETEEINRIKTKLESGVSK